MSGNLAASLPRVARNCFWEITDACNLRCIHCEADAGIAAPDELDESELLRVAEQLPEIGCERVYLTGGEPLVRWQWPKLARRIADLGMQPIVVTNGIRVGSATLDTMRAAGVRELSISLDGLAEAHDALRLPVHTPAPSRFDAVMRAIRLSVSAGLRTAVVTTIHRRNLEDLPEMYQLLSGLGVSAWQVQLCIPQGRMRGQALAYLLEPSQLPQVEDVLVRLIQDGRMRIAVGDNIGYYGQHEPVLRGSVRGTQSFWLGCFAGCKTVAICSNGDVKGCPSHPKSLVVGNLRRETLAEIWGDASRFAYNTQWDEQLLSSACASCAYRRLCRGGCRTMALCSTGRIYDDPYCVRRSSNQPALSLGRDRGMSTRL